MQISKRLIAREWLIFVVLFPFGSIACYCLGYWVYYQGAWLHYYPSFDGLWNTGFGLFTAKPYTYVSTSFRIAFPSELWTLSMWLVPYFLVTLARSVWWAIKQLK